MEEEDGVESDVVADYTPNDDVVLVIDPEMDDGGESDGINFEVWQIVLAGIGSFIVVFIVVRFITKLIILKKFEKDL